MTSVGRVVWRTRVLGGALLVLGCDGQSLTHGLTEPISVRGAQFVPGELPGRKPLSAEALGDGEVPMKPRPTSAGTVTSTIRQGLAGVVYSGFATADTKAIAIALAGEGTGYWLAPVGFPDPANNGDLSWNFAVDFNHEAPTGRQRLRVAALDGRGRAGTQSEVGFCLGSRLPDNRNACDPTIKPPDIVVALEWDTPVDLDLKIRTPGDQLIASLSPSNAIADDTGVVDVRAEGVGILDFDSNKDCVIDGRQREHVSWQSATESGLHRVYVNLENACGESSVRYRVTLYAAIPSGDGTYELEALSTSSGTLIAAQVKVGALGTRVTEFEVP